MQIVSKSHQKPKSVGLPINWRAVLSENTAPASKCQRKFLVASQIFQRSLIFKPVGGSSYLRKSQIQFYSSEPFSKLMVLDQPHQR